VASWRPAPLHATVRYRKTNQTLTYRDRITIPSSASRPHRSAPSRILNNENYSDPDIRDQFARPPEGPPPGRPLLQCQRYWNRKRRGAPTRDSSTLLTIPTPHLPCRRTTSDSKSIRHRVALMVKLETFTKRALVPKASPVDQFRSGLSIAAALPAPNAIEEECARAASGPGPRPTRGGPEQYQGHAA
jgi:hypothetical protein